MFGPAEVAWLIWLVWWGWRRWARRTAPTLAPCVQTPLATFATKAQLFDAEGKLESIRTLRVETAPATIVTSKNTYRHVPADGPHWVYRAEK